MINGNRSFELSEIVKLDVVFRQYPEIRVVYLFGSAASRHARLDSDIDLAVIHTESLIKKKKLDILAKLTSNGYCKIGLVFTDQSDLVLAYEAVRQNKLIYAADDFNRGATYSNIVRKYLDSEYFMRPGQDAYRRKNIAAQS